MDFEAIEAYEAENKLTPAHRAPGESNEPDLMYWEVWFREEYFGTVPEAIIGDVVLVMMAHGGFVRDPGRRLESMHSPAGYHGMVTAIVARLNRWLEASNRLENDRTEV